MTPETEDLIARLRNVTEGDAYAHPWTFGELCRQAASALQAAEEREKGSANASRAAMGPVAHLAGQAEPSGAWRPIETAPRDGTPVMGWIVYDGSLEWSPDTFQRPSIISWDDGCDNPGWERPAGWDQLWIGEPTHWMPLPEAPK